MRLFLFTLILIKNESNVSYIFSEQCLIFVKKTLFSVVLQSAIFLLVKLSSAKDISHLMHAGISTVFLFNSQSKGAEGLPCHLPPYKRFFF